MVEGRLGGGGGRGDGRGEVEVSRRRRREETERETKAGAMQTPQASRHPGHGAPLYITHYRITALACSVTVYRASMLPYTTHSATMAGTAPNPVVFFDIGLSGRCLP
jgi:hypothetical protein